MTKTIGVLPLARSTFDVEFAQSKSAQAYALLEDCGHRVVGSRELLFDADSAATALDALASEPLDLILVLQVTFTDASMTVVTAQRFDLPVAIWALPEPRLGGRLRLNAYCGLNLAAHALGLNDREFSYLYADPERPESRDDLEALLAGQRKTQPVTPTRPSAPESAHASAREVVERLKGQRFARLGDHPEGFHTCSYNADRLHALLGIEVDRFPLDNLFNRAAGIDPARVESTRTQVGTELQALELLDQGQLDKSLRLKSALDDIRREGKYAAFAIRCWPETFTEYGGAVCGPVSMMGEQKVPCACEADVFGALTSLVLQELADAPAFQVDLVDLDHADGTGVVWHCGQAPISMADPDSDPSATIHTNRKMPLLYEFALKPGRVTFARFSQARGEIKLMIASGEMQKSPKTFTGTSGVVRYDASTEQVEQTIMGAGLEHHSCLVYGDYRAELRGVAQALDIPCIELT